MPPKGYEKTKATYTSMPEASLLPITTACNKASAHLLDQDRTRTSVTMAKPKKSLFRPY